MAALGRILLSFEVAIRCKRLRDGAPTLTDTVVGGCSRPEVLLGQALPSWGPLSGLEWRSPKMVDEWQLRSKRGLCALSEANNAPTQQLIIIIMSPTTTRIQPVLIRSICRRSHMPMKPDLEPTEQQPFGCLLICPHRQDPAPSCRSMRQTNGHFRRLRQGLLSLSRSSITPCSCSRKFGP